MGHHDHGPGFVDTKYNLQKEEKEPQLEFFNYHEFLIPNQDSSQAALVINHFPNFFADKSSSTFHKTRIARIPRCYDTVTFSDLIPQFSTIYPGQEEGAIKTNGAGNVATGFYDGGKFGTTSEVVGLESVLPKEDLLSIITQVNSILYDAFYPFCVIILIENVLDIVTGGLFIQLLNFFSAHTHTKRKVLELERFVEDVNSKWRSRDLEIISPRKTGYLSICIVYVPNEE
ncbi:ERF4 [Candida theae]|uniref:Ras modification protein ERF4 n=1 Tax=Candida theae TaxID=1198502 RepID=A0AAD5BE04_9ASCO|nr:ERF4 [Candida theae]KAI5957822.1 ERF4 [Candida theae]